MGGAQWARRAREPRRGDARRRRDARHVRGCGADRRPPSLLARMHNTHVRVVEKEVAFGRELDLDGAGPAAVALAHADLAEHGFERAGLGGRRLARLQPHLQRHLARKQHLEPAVRRRVQVRQVGHVEKEVVCGESAAERVQRWKNRRRWGASARGGGGRFVSLTAPGSHAPMLGTRYPVESDIIVDMPQYARISRSAGVCARAVRERRGRRLEAPRASCGMPSYRQETSNRLR